MAECQIFRPYEASLTDALRGSLSEPRLDPYLKDRDGVEAHALKWYLWNARLAKAFLFPLHTVEVVTRNAVHAALAYTTGQADWLLNPPAHLLTPESEASRQAAVDRLNRQRVPLSSDQLVAALSFDFWSNLFRDEYAGLWDAPTLRHCFAHYPAKADRSFIHRRAKRLNHLRNRIAHHEPIWNEPDLSTRFKECEEVVGLVSPLTAKWMSEHSTVLKTIRFPPSGESQLPGRPLHTFSFKTPPHLALDASLEDALATIAGSTSRTPVVVQDGAEIKILEAVDLIRLLEHEFRRDGGMADITALTVDDALKHTRAVVEEITNDMSTGDVLAAFFKTRKERRERPTHLAVIREGAVAGIIRRPTINFTV